MSDERRAELRAATLRGVRWISIARVIAETTGLASTVLLARMIPPADFGRAAVALIIVAFATIIGPAGLTSSLIQRRNLERRHLEAASFLSLTVGGSLTLLTIALVPSARSLFGGGTAELLLLASPAWLVSGFGAVSQAMLQRHLRFRRIALVDSVSVLGGASTAVGLAVAGFDGEALVGGALVTMVVATASAVIASPPPVIPRPSRRGIAEVGRFAALVSLSSLAYAGFRNIDYAILGARMSAANVGYYWRAYQLGVEYQGKLSQIMLRISFPVYSRTENLDELRRFRMRIVRVHASVLVPLLAAFAAVAPVAIPSVFGSAWTPAVVPAQILAAAGIGSALVTGTGPLMVAIGRPGLLLVWNFGELLGYGGMIYLLAPSGLIVVSIGVAAFSGLGVVLTQVVLLRSLIGLPIRESVEEALPGFVVASCMFAALWALRAVLDGVGVPSVVLLASCSAVGFALYVVLLRTFFAATWFDLASIIRTVGGGRSGHVTEGAPAR